MTSQRTFLHRTATSLAVLSALSMTVSPAHAAPLKMATFPPPTMPKFVTVSGSTSSSSTVFVEWVGVSGQSYELWRYSNQRWDHVHTGTGSSARVPNTPPGPVWFVLRARNKAGGTSSWASVQVIVLPPKPDRLHASPSPATGGNFLLTWRSSATATYYELSERHGKGSLKPLGKTTNTYFQFMDHARGQFSFQIRACNQHGCGLTAVSDTLDVSMPVKPWTDPVEESVCAPSEVPPDVEKFWDELRRKKLAEPLKEDEEPQNTGLPDKDDGRDELPVGIVTEQDLVNELDIDLATDRDGDCLSNEEEIALSLDPDNPDTDGDGWFDGPCNRSYNLVLTQIHSKDEQEDLGDDEFYLIVDGARYPTASDDDGWWNQNDGTVRNLELPIASRSRGVFQEQWLAAITLRGYENDMDPLANWEVDDLLFKTTVDLEGVEDGGEIIVEKAYSDWHYVLTFRVDVETFADPTPDNPAGDADGDGLEDSVESNVGIWLGGIVDPRVQDVLVEVDWTPGHKLRRAAKHQVVSTFARHGIRVMLHRDELVPVDGCVSVLDAQDLYIEHFSNRWLGGTYPTSPGATPRPRPAFRYAIMAGEVWNGRSGVATGHTFLVANSTWYINGARSQAGTFIHELGHTLGLTNRLFDGIDTYGSTSYQSAMNYLYQIWIVDYSDSDGGFFDNHDDWAFVEPQVHLPPDSGVLGKFVPPDDHCAPIAN